MTVESLKISTYIYTIIGAFFTRVLRQGPEVLKVLDLAQERDQDLLAAARMIIYRSCATLIGRSQWALSRGGTPSTELKSPAHGVIPHLEAYVHGEHADRFLHDTDQNAALSFFQATARFVDHCIGF